MDFLSPTYLSASKKQKQEIAIDEFKRCAASFAYFLKTYAKIRHPNAGTISIQPFDFQLDVAIPISKVLLTRRSEESKQAVKNYKYRFEYNAWFKQLCEEQIETSRVIPAEFHNFHKITAKHADFKLRIDSICLKSRQTGLSTIFQLLGLWHVNFHTDIYDLVLSQTDREAKKFLNNVATYYELIPKELRARKILSNEHIIALSLSGGKKKRSALQALPPTADVGRSYDPNLIVLDEFAMYKNAASVWTSISMSASAGGVLVIISTPNGVGNLFHKLWTVSNKTLSTSGKDTSALRPMVVHWSQMPLSEFSRRGFKDSFDWYCHMCAKISVEHGEQGIAQELNLDFLASGNTLSPAILKRLRERVLESKQVVEIVAEPSPLAGLVIYEEPLEGAEYLVGVDTAEGVLADFSAFFVVKLSREFGELPVVVARFSSNSISIVQYKDKVCNVGNYYNEAFLHIERNNHGHVLIAYLVDDKQYNPFKVLNRYDPIRSGFVKDVKGWNSVSSTRGLLVATLLDFLSENKDRLSLSLSFVETMDTFVLTPSGKWEAAEGYWDDEVIAYGLCVIGWKLLSRYRQFLLEEYGWPTDEIDGDIAINSSGSVPMRINGVDGRGTPFLKKGEVDMELLRRNFDPEEAAKYRPQVLNDNVINKYFMTASDELAEYDDVF